MVLRAADDTALLSRNEFSIIDNRLIKSIPRKAQGVLQLQDKDEKRVIPPSFLGRGTHL